MEFDGLRNLQIKDPNDEPQDVEIEHSTVNRTFIISCVLLWDERRFETAVAPTTAHHCLKKARLLPNNLCQVTMILFSTGTKVATETEIKYLDLPDTTFKNFNNNRGDISEIDKVFTKNRQNLSRDRKIIDNVNINADAENRGSKRYGHQHCFFFA